MGGYEIIDQGSSNGTFLGPEKIDCRENPGQLLKDRGLLYLGREAFLCSFVYNENGKIEAESESEPEAKDFVCRNCYNFNSPVQEFTCPECNTYND